MHYQKCCSILYPSVDHPIRSKSYLWGGRKTTNTDGYLVLKNSPKSYLGGGGGRTTTNTDGYMVLEILLSPTYGVDG